MTGVGQQELNSRAQRRLSLGSRKMSVIRTTEDEENEQFLDHQNEDDDDENDELLSEALLAVASAEEYTAKIIKLQQACLTPLKEDLADWLNKIMYMSTITSDNFMDKLDNGVIICRMAKIISIWCQQQLVLETTSSKQHQNFNLIPQQTHNNIILNTNQTTHSNQHNWHQAQATNRSAHNTTPNTNREFDGLLSISTLDVTATHATNGEDIKRYTPIFQDHNNRNNITSSGIATPLRQTHLSSHSTFANSVSGPSRISSQSTNCLTTSSMTSLIGGCTSRSNQFFQNLVRMEQTKIWEDAKCRTFYARDNVSNFIRWSKEFGVNQSVLFESDDLVLHANTRQVVLCLLDVARIACVKHGFTEAPGLVRFEQEIDREIAAEKAAVEQYAQGSIERYKRQDETDGDNKQSNRDELSNRESSSRIKNSRKGSFADATDDLIMRYCLHKEEEAAKKKAAAELEATVAKLREQAEKEAKEIEIEKKKSAVILETPEASFDDGTVNLSDNAIEPSISTDDTDCLAAKLTTLTPLEVGEKTDVKESMITPSKSPLSDSNVPNRHNLSYDNRVDSLDSGEGRTESASTSHSRTPTDSSNKNNCISSIPRPIKRSESNSSLMSNPTSSIGTSELSSSRSSLLSAQESNTTKRTIASDLDGKVMRIAKSYYGKGATKGVTRLSEGKYKIADRIVFVRLLKGHRVMVRIGGGWDTLENFLFRHKSDPSQVIDVDNLLPIETKMTFEKSPQLTPTNNKFSKLPFYRRSSSASSTNLSVSNTSVSNQSPIISNITSNFNNPLSANDPQAYEISSSSQRLNTTKTPQQIPYLLIHSGETLKQTPHQTLNFHPSNIPQHQSPMKGNISQQKTLSNNFNKYNNRPLTSSSRSTTTGSTTNLYPATLTTRLTPSTANAKLNSPLKLNSTVNLNYKGRASRQEALRKLGRSSDSLQANYQYKSPQQRQHFQNGSSSVNTKKKVDTHRRSNNGLVNHANAVKS